MRAKFRRTHGTSNHPTLGESTKFQLTLRQQTNQEKQKRDRVLPWGLPRVDRGPRHPIPDGRSLVVARLRCSPVKGGANASEMQGAAGAGPEPVSSRGTA